MSVVADDDAGAPASDEIDRQPTWVLRGHDQVNVHGFAESRVDSTPSTHPVFSILLSSGSMFAVPLKVAPRFSHGSFPTKVASPALAVFSPLFAKVASTTTVRESPDFALHAKPSFPTTVDPGGCF